MAGAQCGPRRLIGQMGAHAGARLEQQVVGLRCPRSPSWIGHAYLPLQRRCRRARRFCGHVHARREALLTREQAALTGVFGNDTQVAGTARVERCGEHRGVGITTHRRGAKQELAPLRRPLPRFPH